MYLREILSDYWCALQQELFPRLEGELGPKGERRPSRNYRPHPSFLATRQAWARHGDRKPAAFAVIASRPTVSLILRLPEAELPVSR